MPIAVLSLSHHPINWATSPRDDSTRLEERALELQPELTCLPLSLYQHLASQAPCSVVRRCSAGPRPADGSTAGTWQAHPMHCSRV